jgi:GTP pyrophosphokinase
MVEIVTKTPFGARCQTADKRHVESVDLDRMIRELTERHPDWAELRDAIDLAIKAHEGQHRKTGDPYVTHPIAVASIVSEWGLDRDSVVSAVLHDVVEDTPVSLGDIKGLFGESVSNIVDGLTKLDGIKLVEGVEPVDAKSAANLQKLLLSMSAEPRVLIVKLADRLHNIRTLDGLEEEKARRVARETMDVHAQLARKLGMTHVATELEDECFKTLYPARYRELRTQTKNRMALGRERLERVIQDTRAALDVAGIKAVVTGRRKHLWSVYEKMITKQRSLEDIYDLVGLRVIVQKEAECYLALGVIHALYTPVPGRFKDWIASPKFNMYQSLHTTVLADRDTMEVQIRTLGMHEVAEWGIAAHWSYKSGENPEAAWLGRLDGDISNPLSYLEHVKSELGRDEVYCFTPRGDVMALASGSTCVDFAYAVHTEVGNRCRGAKVNSVLVPLSHVLKNGDRVEIVTGGDGTPLKEWLSFAVSSKARSKIRTQTTSDRERHAVSDGRSQLAEAVGRLGVPQRVLRPDGMERAAKHMGFPSRDDLLRAIGRDEADADAAAKIIAGVTSPVAPVGRDEENNNLSEHVAVEGSLSWVVIRSRCCKPVTGDRIVGLVVGVETAEIHRDGCSIYKRDGDESRFVEVSWLGDSAAQRVEITIEAIDRDGLLSEVAGVISGRKIPIVASNTDTGNDMIARERFLIKVGDISQLNSLLDAIRDVKGVFDARRS